jgi:hypothetical protein
VLGAGLLLVFLIAGTVGILWACGVFSAAPPASGAGADSPRDRLVGQWEHVSPTGARMILDVRKDGAVQLTGMGSARTVVENGTWEALNEKKDRLTIRLVFRGQPRPSEWDIELLPNNEMRVNFLTSSSRPVLYKRRQ